MGPSARNWSLVVALLISSCSGSSTQPVPNLTISSSSLPAAEVGAAYSASLRASGGEGGHSWSLQSGVLPDGLQLSSSGSISGTPTTTGVFSFSVRVSSGDGQAASAALSIDVRWPVLVIETSSLPDADVDQPFAAPLTARGGDGDYSWSVVAGALVGGLELDEALGTIDGTPEEAGISSFTVQVTSGDAQNASRELQLIVRGPVIILNTLLPVAAIGEPFESQLAAEGGDTSSYAWTVTDGALPPGVDLSASGTLSGLPTAGGVFNFDVEAASGGYEGSTGVTVTVSNAPSTAYNIAAYFVDDDPPAEFAPSPATQALVDAGVKNAIEWALAKWEQVIQGDIPELQLSALVFPPDACGGKAELLQGPIDDVTIIISVEPIDGDGGTLATAGACVIRSSPDPRGLPAVGQVTFDEADITIPPGVLREVALHEIAHALGFTRSYFEAYQLAVGLDTANPQFVGPNAVAQYQAVGGASGSIMLEALGGPGTAFSHWDEITFDTELMTPSVANPGNPLSVMTAGAMQDLGYDVDLVSADPYACPAVCTPPPQVVGATLHFGNDVIVQPIYAVDENGTIVEVIEP